jgi:hypothetical protein
MPVPVRNQSWAWEARENGRRERRKRNRVRRMMGRTDVGKAASGEDWAEEIV